MDVFAVLSRFNAVYSYVLACLIALERCEMCTER
jgi:hypothetical protein